MKIRKKAYRDGIGILKKELRREKGIAFPLGWVPMPIEFAVASERERERERERENEYSIYIL